MSSKEEVNIKSVGENVRSNNYFPTNDFSGLTPA